MQSESMKNTHEKNSNKPIVEIYKVMNISSAHQLNLPYESKCNRYHGHNWKVEVWVKGHLNENGMVMDFNHVKKEVMKLDHVNINDYVIPPTAETISVYLAQRLLEVSDDNVLAVRVRVSETPSSYAEYIQSKN